MISTADTYEMSIYRIVGLHSIWGYEHLLNFTMAVTTKCPTYPLGIQNVLSQHTSTATSNSHLYIGYIAC